MKKFKFDLNCNELYTNLLVLLKIIKLTFILIFISAFSILAGNTHTQMKKQDQININVKETDGMNEAVAQQRQVSGKVTNTAGEPIPGVAVTRKGTTTGTTTDAEGKFTLNVPANSTLVFSFVGMKMQEVPVDDRTSFAIIMSEEVVGIEDVVVIGYGTVKKNDLTGSVATVNSKQLETTLSNTLVKSLEGTVAGVGITQTNFAPGSGQDILVHGVKSLSASNFPLIILDGMPYDGNMNDINPNDIESVTVLKDASSAAIYGARAANGVILITSKSGKAGKLKINYNGLFGVASVANTSIKVLDGPGYVSFIQERLRQMNGTVNADPLTWMFSNEVPQYNAKTETNWMDLVLRSPAQFDQTLSISGGDEKTSYYTSLGYLDQPGIIVNSGFKRYSLRVNITHTPYKWLTFRSNVQLSNSDYGHKMTADIINAMRMSPYGKLKEVNGSYSFYPQYPDVYFPSPFANDKASKDDFARRAVIDLSAEIKPTFLPGLSYRFNFGYDFQNAKQGVYYPSNSYTGFSVKGDARIYNANTIHWTWENILNYNRTFGDHHIDIVGLYSREGNRLEEAYQQGTGFVNDQNLYHYMDGAVNKTFTSKLTERNLVSYMGRVNYSYNDKYFVTITTRRDGYSGFGKKNKFGTFPSAALGWTISNEEFAKNMGAFNFLKLRLSYGVNGNMGVAPYQTLDRFTTANTIYGDNTNIVNGLKLDVVGNPELKWEGMATYNAGVDFGLLKNRISGSIDVFSRKSNDLLMTRVVPVMNGYTSIWYNIGKTSGKGIDLTVRSLNINTKDFQWSTTLTFTLDRDKIVDLRGDKKDDIANNWFIGKPLQVIYGFEWGGIWQTTDAEKFAKYAPTGVLSKHLGKPYVKDISGDGKIDLSDRKVLASRQPSFRSGLTNEFSYKNFTLSVFLSIVEGLKRENDWYNPSFFLVERNTNYLDVPYWSATNPSKTYISAGNQSADAGYPNYGPTNVKNASFVRIQNASLSYRIPERLIAKSGISNIRISLMANNLYTFTSWLGWDPEATTQYPVQNYYPSARTINLGINLDF